MSFLKSFCCGAAILAVGSLCSSPALATDFTFVVPVNVSHIPSDAYQMNVFCDTVDPAYRIIGQQITSVPLTGGAFSGDVTIAFDALAGRDAASATVYECQAIFLSRLHPDQPYFQRSTGSVTLTFPLRSGAAFYIDTGTQPLR